MSNKNDQLYSYNDITESEMEQMWIDANFQTKTKIVKSGQQNRQDKIRRLNNDNFYVANCKICQKEIKLSCRYAGEYPLCYIHRDPNDRILKKN